MLQLTYISTAKGISDADLSEILAASRRNNLRDGITGLLLFNGKRFLQALEGSPELVRQAYERIKTDRRHRAPVVLASGTVEDRQFGSWDMAFQRIQPCGQPEALIATVDALVADVSDPVIRAQFSSYVRLQAAA